MVETINMTDKNSRDCELHKKPFKECCGRPRSLGTPDAWDPAARANCIVCGNFHPTVKNRDPEAVGLICEKCK